jgi:tRNA dimethylallyltransferase
MNFDRCSKKIIMKTLKPYNSLVICGPTACGKTRIGVQAAVRYHGEIISADSRQVYRTMDLGTGKDIDEYKIQNTNIPYHCIDIVDPDDVYTLFRYMRDFNKAFDDIISRNSLPVIVGGTGLYIEAALKQYVVSEVPENPEFRQKMMMKEKDELVQMLSSKDQELCRRTDLTSKKRIVRALEIYQFQDASQLKDSFIPLEVKPLVCVVFYDKEELCKRIDKRVDDRIAHGMIDEVQSLITGGIRRERLLMFGMEYSCIGRYLFGEFSLDEMKVSLKNEIHRLAKRQMTWFRGMEKRGIALKWFNGTNASELFEYIHSNFE